MTKDDILNVLSYIADTDSECADNVFVAITLLSTNIEKMLDAVKFQIKNEIDKNNFSNITQLTKYCTNITELYDTSLCCLETLIRKQPQNENFEMPSTSFPTQLFPEIPDEQVLSAQEKPEESVKSDSYIPVGGNSIANSQPVNYSLFRVNRYEEHTLDENFEHKKVCGFCFEGKKYNADSWKDVLLILSSIFAKQNIKLFESFVDDSEMNGKKNAYYSMVPEFTASGHIKNELVPGTNVYVHTNASANDIVSRIKKLLLKYGYRISDFCVFLRADYTR